MSWRLSLCLVKDGEGRHAEEFCRWSKVSFQLRLFECFGHLEDMLTCHRYVFIMLFYRDLSKSCITKCYRLFGVDLELSKVKSALGAQEFQNYKNAPGLSTKQSAPMLCSTLKDRDEKWQKRTLPKSARMLQILTEV